MKLIKNEIFGSFVIADNEFAISVNFVNEVVNAPKNYTKLPLSPDYLLGLFNLRGMIIPVVDINRILNIKDNVETEENRKIAIIEYGSLKIGLLFDKVGEIFKSQDEEKNDFENNYENGIISGLFRKENGQRIIQILDVEELLRLKDIQLYNKDKDFSQSHLKVSKRGLKKQCITFSVDQSVFALEISSIQEILKLTKLSSTIKTNSHSLGVVNVRGSTVPVINFSALLGIESANEIDVIDSDRRIIIIKVEDERFGLAVNSVNSITSFYADELKPFPVLSGFKSNLYVGCITDKDGTEVLLLDSKYLLSDKEIVELTHGHSKLFKTTASTNSVRSQKSKKKTYISFSIDSLFAIGIEDVKEIIDEPKMYIKAPNLPDYYKGAINLRGELVFIVEPLKLYKKNGENKVQGKILILNNQDKKIGILVESVESILSLSDENKIPIPSMMLTQKDKLGIAADVKEVLSFTKEGESKKDLLLIDAKSIINKIFNLAG